MKVDIECGEVIDWWGRVGSGIREHNRMKMTDFESDGLGSWVRSQGDWTQEKSENYWEQIKGVRRLNQ